MWSRGKQRNTSRWIRTLFDKHQLRIKTYTHNSKCVLNEKSACLKWTARWNGRGIGNSGPNAANLATLVFNGIAICQDKLIKQDTWQFYEASLLSLFTEAFAIEFYFFFNLFASVWQKSNILINRKTTVSNF